MEIFIIFFNLNKKFFEKYENMKNMGYADKKEEIFHHDGVSFSKM